jgi:hypothetical protein
MTLINKHFFSFIDTVFLKKPIMINPTHKLIAIVQTNWLISLNLSSLLARESSNLHNSLSAVKICVKCYTSVIILFG